MFLLHCHVLLNHLLKTNLLEMLAEESFLVATDSRMFPINSSVPF